MRASIPIEINDRFRQALELLEGSDRHVFITGKAGTGKSTLLSLFRARTSKRIAVLAPTGVAALNVGGQTIHSFCGFGPDVSLDKIRKQREGKEDRPTLYKKLDAVIIDEISMVRADLLDCLEKFLRLHGPRPRKPFGGIQMIFFGDLYQLPPVVTSVEKALFEHAYDTPYFFSARIFQHPRFSLEFVELEKVYRQSDEEFIALLNAIRNRSVGEEDLQRLNERCLPDFIPPDEDLYIYLTSTNEQAFRLNRERLDRLPGRPHRYEGFLEGDFEPGALPTDPILEVKKDAQVMLLNNDPLGRWVNGTLGKVERILTGEGEEDLIQVELYGGGREAVGPYTWKLFRYVYDEARGRIVSQPVGSFTQYPLKLAWAVTIHKSQGKTFERVILDIGRGTFAHGQVYVALSRCTSFQGLVLRQPIHRRHILMDYRVVRFLTRFQYDQAEERLPYREKVRILRQAAAEGKEVEIVYLKPDDTKTRRRIRPEEISRMEYQGKSFEGLRAFCHQRQDIRHFRIDRILEIKPL